jgi:hypothetical protein
MTGRRRHFHVVIAQPVVSAITAAVVLLSLGNLIAIGCVVGWLRHVDGGAGSSAMILFVIAAVVQVFGGAAALIAWAYSR